MADYKELIIAILLFIIPLIAEWYKQKGKKRKQERRQSSPPTVAPRPVASRPAVPPSPPYRFTAEEEGRGFSPNSAIAAAEAAEAGTLAAEAETRHEQERATEREQLQRLEAHRRRWRRAVVDSVMLGAPRF